MFSKEVQFQDETISSVSYLARACPFLQEKEEFLLFKIYRDRPQEFTVKLSSLLKGTFNIKEHLKTEEDSGIELGEEGFKIVSSP